MTYRLRSLLLLSLLALPGISTAQVDEPERLRIHGSNLLGASLVPALVGNWLRSIGYTDINRRDLGPARSEISASRDGQPLIVEIDKRGTATGIADIIDGNAEISMSARAPTAKELDAAWQLGDLTSSGQEWVVALDGVALVVAPNNPVSELSLPQLRDVLSGKIRDWQALGGRPGAITVHALAPNTGTQELLSRLVPVSAKAIAQSKRHASYEQIVAALGSDPNGIGIVSLRAARGGLKALAVRDGARAFAPDLLSVRSEDYPLAQRLYFHTGQLITALGRGFVQYAISPAGQAVVEQSAFVSLNLKAMPAITPANAPEEYQQIVSNAKRLPITLHFSSGLDMFDSRARQDMDRLAAFLRQPENAQRKLVLVAFGNPQPSDPYQSLSLSNTRVDYVSSELQALSLKVVTARGFGGRMNLTDAHEPSARYRNERVELWLR
jgi:phosphate transport system substrate-binding protein